MAECFDSLGYATRNSTLDANSKNLQIVVAKEHQHKTAVASHYGIFGFICMPFGFKITPGTFQGAMDVLETNHK